MRSRLPLLVAIAIGAAALAGTGCSRRERANPFDPHNPTTRGGPSGFMALAANGRVNLRWDPVVGAGLQGFRLYRKTPADTAYVAISALLFPNRTQYSDLGLRNGLDHAYRLYFVLEGEGETGPPAEDIATPGPGRPWVAEAGGGRLLGLTPDGRHVAVQQSGFSSPATVAVDSVSGRVWVSDSFAGRVASLDPISGVLVSIPGLVSPGAMAAEPITHSAWVCDEQDGVVREFSSTGSPLGAPIEPVSTPIGIAIGAWDRSLWICERGADQVRHYSSNLSLVGTIPIPAPSRVTTDSVAQRAWVTSFGNGRVYRIAPSGTKELDLPGFQGPIGLAVDTRRGRVWVTEALGNRITVLDRQTGAVLFRVTGLSETREVAVDPETGEAWAVAPGSGQVVKISPAGTVLQRLGGLSQPFGIAFDPGR